MIYNPESGTNETTYRQQAPVQGRWLTPDPAGLAAVDVTNPQSWNMYAYVVNNPVSFADPSGLLPGGLGNPCAGDAGGIVCGGDDFDDSNFIAIGNSTSSCPICKGPYDLGTQGITQGWFGVLFGFDSGSVAQGPLTLSFLGGETVFGAGTEVSPYIMYVSVFSPFGPQGNRSNAANNGLLFAGVLPPGMDGALRAAKQAAKGIPKTTPGPTLTPGKWRPPQSIEDLLNDASKAIKYVLDNIDFPRSGDFLFMIDPCITNPRLGCGPNAPPQS